MLIDKKGRLLGKVSIVDAAIILIILVIAAAAYGKFGKEAIIGASKEDMVVICLQQDEVPDYVAKSIKKGDVVIEDVQKAEFGKVKDITINKSISWAQTDKGEFIKSTKEGYSSISVKVDGKGELSGQGFLIGTYKYYIGKTLTMNVGNTTINAKISEIKLTETK